MIQFTVTVQGTKLVVILDGTTVKAQPKFFGTGVTLQDFRDAVHKPSINDDHFDSDEGRATMPEDWPFLLEAEEGEIILDEAEALALINSEFFTSDSARLDWALKQSKVF